MQNKLELIMQLKNKLFNNKLRETQEKLGKATDGMKKKLSGFAAGFTNSFKQMTAQVPLLGQAFDLLGNPYVMLASGIVAVTGLMSAATTEAAKFDKSFLAIQNLNLDKSKDSLRDYKGLILQTAFETGQNAVKTADSMFAMQSALDVYGKDAAIIFRDVAKFSTATGAGLEDTMDSVSKAIKAFGLEAKDTQNILSGFTKVDQVGLTTLKEFTQVMPEFAGAAAGAGQKIDTANKVFAGFTTIAKNSQIAATMVKGAFEGLTQKSTVDGLKSIGIAMYDAKGNMRGLESIIIDVDKRFKNMNSRQIDELINKIGGNEGLRALLTKVKTGADDFIATMNAYDSSSFDLDEALKNAMGDFTVLSDIVKNRLNVVMISLGQKILPYVATMFDSINKSLEWAYRNWDSISSVLRVIGDALKVGLAMWAGTQAAIGLATLQSIGLTGALGLLQTGFYAVGAAITSIPILGWIAGAIAAIIILYKKVDWFRAGIDAMGAVLKKFFVSMWEGAKKVLGGVVDMFTGLKDIIAGVFTLDDDQISKGIKSFKKGFKNAVDGSIEVNPVANAIRNGKEYGRTATDAYAKSMKESAKNKPGSPAVSGLLPAKTSAGTTDKTSKETAAQIGSVTGKASQPRSIVVNIGALNQGGINTSNTTLAKKTPEEIEEWFTEAMMRVLRSVELSYE